MPDPYKINLVVIDEVRVLVDNAAKHYAAVRANCEQATRGLKLTGGFGETGAYQAEISQFAEQWGFALGEFLEHERAFVTFLEEMRESLQKAHGLYQSHEREAAELLAGLGEQLDELGG